MKRLFCVLVALLLVVSVSAFSESTTEYIHSHYSLFIDGNAVPSAYGNPFDFDVLSIDIYFMKSMESAYVCIAKSFSGIFITNGLQKVKIAEQNGVYYFAFDNGDYITGHFDEEDPESFWIDYGASSFRMNLVKRFSVVSDWK